MKCCGEIRAGKFCEDCGKQLVGQPVLYGLLKHVRVTAKALRYSYDGASARRQGETSERHTAWMERRLDKVQKWETWASELEKMLAKETNDPS